MNRGLIKEKYVFFAKYAITLIFHVYKIYIKYMIILLQLAEKYINNELKKSSGKICKKINKNMANNRQIFYLHISMSQYVIIRKQLQKKV